MCPSASSEESSMYFAGLWSISCSFLISGFICCLYRLLPIVSQIGYGQIFVSFRASLTGPRDAERILSGWNRGSYTYQVQVWVQPRVLPKRAQQEEIVWCI